VDATRSAVARHLAAIADRDLPAYAATLHDDVLVVLPTGAQLHGRAAVVDFHRDFFADLDWSQELAEVRFVATDDTISTLHEATYRDVDRVGEPVLKRFLVGLVFTQNDGEWLLLHDQCTQLL
jgi:uncharacterized protein (TIGR02246 family)